MTFSLPGAAKLESFSPDPPAKPLAKLAPNPLPLLSAPNPVVGAPKPLLKPDAPLSPDVVPSPVGAAGLLEFAPAKIPNPDVVGVILDPNTLGLEAPMVPNGEVVEPAKAPNPEAANADAAGFSPSMLPNIFGDVPGEDEDFDFSVAEAVGESDPELFLI